MKEFCNFHRCRRRRVYFKTREEDKNAYYNKSIRVVLFVGGGSNYIDFKKIKYYHSKQHTTINYNTLKRSIYIFKMNNNNNNKKSF